MVVAKPFKAIRPKSELASKIVSLPYDVINSEEAREIAKNNKYSFLHIDKSEIDLQCNINPYDKKVYEKARDNLNAFIKKGYLIKDKKNYFYIYKETMGKITQIGVAFKASVDDYINGKIKKHELTRSDKELDRINHFDVCNANTSPIFLTYKQNHNIKDIIDKHINLNPDYDFETEDGVKQTIWIIKDDENIKKLEEAFLLVHNMYIADGHHRCESAKKVCEKRREENKNYDGDEDFNYFLAIAFPHDKVEIMDYNRVVKDLNGLTNNEFINRLKDKFEVKKFNNLDGYKPRVKHTFGMYLNNNWYELKAKENAFNKDDIISSLDVSILQKNILEDILNIKDIRTSDRIDFIGGIRGLKELEKRVNTDMKVAFSMYPTDIEDIMKVADKGKVMPPKSTWFEPKLRSGLFVYEI